jgi:hypothetical protein
MQEVCDLVYRGSENYGAIESIQETSARQVFILEFTHLVRMGQINVVA